MTPALLNKPVSRDPERWRGLGIATDARYLDGIPRWTGTPDLGVQWTEGSSQEAAEAAPAEGSTALTAIGLDVEDDQEDGRNQDEQEAGNETEIVGFHG